MSCHDRWQVIATFSQFEDNTSNCQSEWSEYTEHYITLHCNGVIGLLDHCKQHRKLLQVETVGKETNVKKASFEATAENSARWSWRDVICQTVQWRLPTTGYSIQSPTTMYMSIKVDSTGSTVRCDKSLYLDSLHYITLKYFKCPKLTETAKTMGLTMLNNTSHAGKETENKYVFK